MDRPSPMKTLGLFSDIMPISVEVFTIPVAICTVPGSGTSKYFIFHENLHLLLSGDMFMYITKSYFVGRTDP